MDTNPNAETVEVNDDLDTFSDEFFGQSSPEPEKTNSEVEKPEENNDSAPKADDQDDTPEDVEDTEDDDALANEDEDTDDEEEDDEPAPKPKKNRFQERIDELVRKEREAERRAEALEQRLRELESGSKKEDTPKPQPNTQEDGGPRPDAKNEDGTDKYPLGEFDPSYVRDLARHEAVSQLRLAREEEAQERRQAEIEQAKTQLLSEWEQKLAPAQERYPDFEEKGQELVRGFQDIEPAYGEHLTAVLMGLDHGPDVLYHLASNPDLANTIIKSGATKATIALAELNAEFRSSLGTSNEGSQTKKRVSKAPNPPPTNKGSAGGVRTVAPDTDDLDAFEAQFFKKK